jgi:hypothetical protein
MKSGLAMSLLQKLPMQFQLVNHIIECQFPSSSSPSSIWAPPSLETHVLEGTERDAVAELFVDSLGNNGLLKPMKKEFVLTTMWPLPSNLSRPCPQRLYVEVDDDKGGSVRILEMVGRDVADL